LRRAGREGEQAHEEAEGGRHARDYSYAASSVSKISSIPRAPFVIV
jgi:hypothetical protein